jgi:hypothetical protein
MMSRYVVALVATTRLVGCAVVDITHGFAKDEGSTEARDTNSTTKYFRKFH